MNYREKLRVRVFLLAFTLQLTLAVPQTHRADELKSEIGQYQGYSQPIYTEWARVSEYVAVSDGTKLAIDIFRPASNKLPVTDRLPVIWTQQRYGRAFVRDGKLVTQLDKEPWLQTMLQYGYVIGILDARGSGASYGDWPGPFFPREAKDAYDITEWFARQPWCNGRVGMFGRSYMAVTQYLAAGTLPPHLKAIMPEMGTFDLYSSVYSDGVFRNDYVSNWGRLLGSLDSDQHVAPVDSDRSGAMLTGAINNHKTNVDILQMTDRLRYRDSRDEASKTTPYLDWDPSRYIPQINKSDVAIYHVTGWFDLRPRDSLIWFNNLKTPQKLLIGPWFHTQSNGLDMGTERLRWFDCWLKGIDNGIMKEPPIHYYTIGASPSNAWRTARQWPLPDQKLTPYFFQAETSANNGPTRSGKLDDRSPSTETGQDNYTVDYSTTSGMATRWTNGYAGPAGYRAMTSNDEKAVTYTTPPLENSLEVTGHPVSHLWVTASASDADVFVYLEDVDEQGISHYVTEGAIRASHRSVASPTINYIGLPYHRNFAADAKDVPNGEPVELAIDLSPTSYLFHKGHRLRVAITGADKDNAQTAELSRPPVVTIYRTNKHASNIVLPIIPTMSEQDPELPAQQSAGVSTAQSSIIWRWRNLFVLLTLIAAVGLLVTKRKHFRL